MQLVIRIRREIETSMGLKFSRKEEFYLAAAQSSLLTDIGNTCTEFSRSGSSDSK